MLLRPGMLEGIYSLLQSGCMALLHKLLLFSIVGIIDLLFLMAVL